MAAPDLELTNREILKVLEGLISCDGLAQKDGSVLRFDFDENMAWNVGKNRGIFERAKLDYDRSCRTLAASMKIVEGQKITDENAERVSKYIEGCDKLRDKTQKLAGVLKLSRKELLKAGVRVPGVLSNLMPIIAET